MAVKYQAVLAVRERSSTSELSHLRQVFTSLSISSSSVKWGYLGYLSIEAWGGKVY